MTAKWQIWRQRCQSWWTISVKVLWILLLTRWVIVHRRLVSRAGTSSQLKMTKSVLKISERDPDFQSNLVSRKHEVPLNCVRWPVLCRHCSLWPLTESLQAEFGILGVVLPLIAGVKRLLNNVRVQLQSKFLQRHWQINLKNVSRNITATFTWLLPQCLIRGSRQNG